jgi:hypothetical protein
MTPPSRQYRPQRRTGVVAARPQFVDDGDIYTTLGEFDFDEWELSQGWYRTVELEPDTRARCVRAVDSTPGGAQIERIVYREEGGPRLGVGDDSTPETTEQHELDASEVASSALWSPPFEG